MAQFIGTLIGQRNTRVTRLGSKKSGIVAKAEGWNSGIKVYAQTDINGNDEFHVYETGGSNQSKQDEFLLTINNIDINIILSITKNCLNSLLCSDSALQAFEVNRDKIESELYDRLYELIEELK